jgi:hypothetical protein
MSETANTSKGGEFATSRRTKIAEDSDFILTQAEKGVPASAIARMTGRAEADVRTLLECAWSRRPGPPPLYAKRRAAVTKRILEARQQAAKPMPSHVRLTYERIAKAYGVTFEDMMFSAKRGGWVQQARNEAYHLAYRSGEYPSTAIARWFGLLDHTSVLTGIRKHQERVQTERAGKLAA